MMFDEHPWITPGFITTLTAIPFVTLFLIFLPSVGPPPIFAPIFILIVFLLGWYVSGMWWLTIYYYTIYLPKQAITPKRGDIVIGTHSHDGNKHIVGVPGMVLRDSNSGLGVPVGFFKPIGGHDMDDNCIPDCGWHLPRYCIRFVKNWKEYSDIVFKYGEEIQETRELLEYGGNND